MTKTVGLVFVVLLGTLFATSAGAVFADDLPACKNLGNAKPTGISTDVPDNVKALMGAWEGEWTLEGTRTAPSPSSIIFTGVKDGSVTGIYVFNGQVQNNATSFSIDGDNAVSFQSGNVKFGFVYNGSVLQAEREQTGFRATTNMHACALP